RVDNDLAWPLVDLATGSCSDGLHPDRPSENKGAESVLAYLLGLTEIRRFMRTDAGPDRAEQASLATGAQRLTASHRYANDNKELITLMFLNRQALYLRADPA